MFVGTYWFRADGRDDQWHAIREDSSIALCGEVQIRHNVDDTKADQSQIPGGQPVHPACVEAHRAS